MATQQLDLWAGPAWIAAVRSTAARGLAPCFRCEGKVVIEWDEDCHEYDKVCINCGNRWPINQPLCHPVERSTSPRAGYAYWTRRVG